MIGKYFGEVSAIVMVTRKEVDRHWEWGQQAAQVEVFLPATRVNQIPGGQNHVGSGIQAKKVIDCTGEAPRGRHSSVGQISLQAHV